MGDAAPPQAREPAPNEARPTADTAGGYGIDRVALATWMSEIGLPDGPLTDFQPLGGGTQNVMITFGRGGHDYVLRRGPWHLRSSSNAVIAREMRLLAALAGTGVPHPEFVAGESDPDILGAAFYLMAPVRGFNPAVSLAGSYTAHDAGRHRMGLALIDALADLGEVDHERIGLADFGRPDGFLARQVDRWLAEHERYQGLANYPGSPFDDLDRVAGWLADNRGPDSRPGILHGDYHFANVIFDHQEPMIAAIVDWEMATIGDPLVDLGAVLAIWPDRGSADLYESMVGRAGGLPTPDQLRRRYAERSVRDLSAIDWYTVLACFKIGIILEGTYARSCAGQAPVEVGRRLHRYALGLFARARTVITQGQGGF